MKKEKIIIIVELLAIAFLLFVVNPVFAKQADAYQMIKDTTEEEVRKEDKYTMQVEDAISAPRVMDEDVLIREKAYHLSQSEYDTLLRIVEAEASGEDDIGKLLVANVIFNRMKSGKFPSTVNGVVFQTMQFQPTRNGSFYNVRISESTRRAVEAAVYGEDESQGALYFVSSKRAEEGKLSWFRTKLNFLFTHGGHEFYR